MYQAPWERSGIKEGGNKKENDDIPLVLVFRERQILPPLLTNAPRDRTASCRLTLGPQRTSRECISSNVCLGLILTGHPMFPVYYIYNK